MLFSSRFVLNLLFLPSSDCIRAGKRTLPHRADMCRSSTSGRCNTEPRRYLRGEKRRREENKSNELSLQEAATWT